MALSRLLTCGLLVWLVLAAALPAGASEVRLSIRDGRVTLTAKNAPVSDILAAWEKEGRTTIVARERVQGMVTSLELVNEPEATALATVLRGVTGYITAKRDVVPADASIYRFIVINPAPAPAFVTQTMQAAQTGRPAASTSRPPEWMPPSPGPDGVTYPPAFMTLPSSDDGDDPTGGAGGRVVSGVRSAAPGSPASGLARPPSDPYGAPPPTQQSPPRPGQPALTPTFPGAASALPGTAVPPPQAPGAAVNPIRKPPGSSAPQSRR